MPRNGAGTYILPAGNPVVSGTTITTAWANPTMSDVATALTQSLARDGQSAPSADLPMAGHKLTNVAPAGALNEYARADQVQQGVLLRLAGEAGGDAYTATLPFGATAFINGQQVVLKFPVANATPTPTLAINGGAAFPISRQDGSSLQIGDCHSGVISQLMWNDTSWLLVGVTTTPAAVAGVASFNTRLGPVVLLAADITDPVTGALKYVPANKAGDAFTGPVVLPGNAANPLEATPLQQVSASISAAIAAIPTAGVSSFNTRTGPVTLLSGDITNPTTGALGYVPLNKAGDSMGGTLSMANNNVNGAKQINFNGVVDDGASGAAKTIDFTGGNYHKVSMTGNCTFAFTAPSGPCVVHIEMTQSGGGNTMTLPAAVKWPAAYAAADKLLTATAGALDLLVMKWTGSIYIANLIKGIA